LIYCLLNVFFDFEVVISFARDERTQRYFDALFAHRRKLFLIARRNFNPILLTQND